MPRPSGCGYPDATNTGVPTGTKLTVVTGNQKITTAGTIIDSKEIRGCVRVEAPNVTIRNSKILAGDCDFVRIRSLSSGLRLINVELSCGGGYGHGVAFGNYTVIGANIYNCENAFDVSAPGNVRVQDSWIHDLWAGGTAHTDGAQIGQGAANITFTHNTILSPNPGGTAAIIMWTKDDPQNRDVLIADNLLAGGAYTLYCPRQDSTNVHITGNRFGTAFYGPVSSCTPGHVAEFNGNYRDTDLSPVRP